MTELKNLEAWHNVTQQDGLIFVVFYDKTSSCCQSYLRMLEKLAKIYQSKWRFFCVDVYENPELACLYRVSIAPTIMCFNGMQKLHEAITTVTEADLRKSLDILTGEPNT